MSWGWRNGRVDSAQPQSSPHSPSPEAWLRPPFIRVATSLLDSHAREDASTLVEAPHRGLESFSGPPCFLFRVFLGVGQNWLSSKRFIGEVVSFKKKMPLQAFQSTLLPAKVGWGATGVVPICCFVEMFVQDLGFLPSPVSILSLVFPAHILTLHINPLFSFHLSLISHLMSNLFTGWITYNSFTNVFFSFL